METFELEIATPQRLVVRASVKEAQVPAANGYLGILPEHAPLLSELGTGEVSYTAADGHAAKLLVSGGFLEVQPDKTVLLADVAELPEEIDLSAAKTELETAQRQAGSSDPATDYDAATHEVALAETRLAVGKK